MKRPKALTRVAQGTLRGRYELPETVGPFLDSPETLLEPDRREPDLPVLAQLLEMDEVFLDCAEDFLLLGGEAISEPDLLVATHTWRGTVAPRAPPRPAPGPRAAMVGHPAASAPAQPGLVITPAVPALCR